MTSTSPSQAVVSITDDDVPSVTVSFGQASYTVIEGNTVSVKVTLSADAERTVTIPLSTTNQGGASSSDYSMPQNVVFNSGDTEQTFTFSAADDTEDDNSESVRIGVGTLPTGVSEGSPNETTVSIVDNDVTPVTVSFGQATYEAAEGGTVTVKVKLSADPKRTVTIPLTKANQGGASNSDYSGVPASVVFNSGDTEKTFDFEAIQDTVDDDGESVRLGFGTSLPTGVTEGSPSQAVVSITDDDVPAVTVSFEQTTYTVPEGDAVNVKVVLSADPERTVEVPITATNMDGASSADYSVVPTGVVFNSGDTEKTFSFSATDDAVDDDGERVRLTFGTLPTRVSSAAPSQVVVSITDDDVPSVTVSFEQASYTVTEGSSVTVKVKLSANPERTVTIPLSTTNQGGATASDYSGVPANVVFNRGDTEKTFDFEATDDTVDDDGESVRLDFGSSLPTGVTEGSPDETVVSITDDDVPSVTVSFAQATYTVAEGSNITVKVKLSADPERTVTIPLTKTEQGGASSSDYFSVPANVVFNSGETEKTFDFSAASDSVDDDGEAVKLGFGPSLPNGVTKGSPDETVVSITDDDVPSVTVSFEQASYTVAEGSSVTVKVKLSADPERTVTIPLTSADQGGASSSDYSGVPGSVTFNSGDTEQTFSFAAASDSDNDDGESVKLGLGSSLPTGVTKGSPDETVVSITDDDVPSVTVSFEQGSYTVIEGNTVAVKVTLSADPERTVTIPLTKANQGGASSSDYSMPESIVFNSGDTEQTFTFTATDDTEDDNSESVRIGVGTLPTGVSQGTPNETTVSIVDNDATAVAVSFEQSSYTVAEGNSVTVTVVLSANPERTVTIPITKVNQGGASNSDYSGVPANVVFNSGDTEKTFDFEAIQDTVDDDGESVKLGFGSSLPTGVTEGSPDETVVSITDDDTAGVTVSESSLDINEGFYDTYTVVLDTEPVGNVTVTLGGVTGTDVSLDKTTLTFTSGNWGTAQTVMVSARQDADAVDEEEVTITHTVSSADDADYDGVAAGSVAVTVTDDETPTPDFTLTMPAPVHGDTDGDGKVNLGDTLTYTAVAANSGNVPLENVSVKDALINTGSTDCPALPIGATCTSTVTYTIVQADVEAGSVTNTATATATGVAAKTKTRQTPVDQLKSLTLDKTTTATGFEGANESIPYSYKVTNAGTVTLSGSLEIDDDKIESAGTTCPAVPGSGLAVGAFLTCTGYYTTVQADVDAGKVTNEATASLDGVTSGEDIVTVNWVAPQNSEPQLTISSGEVGEGAGNFTFTVTLNPSSLQTVTVDYATSDGTATSGSDYTAASGTLTFSPGDTTKTVSVPVAADDIDEDDETFTLTLTNPVNASIPNTLESGSATIRDDDTAGVTVSAPGTGLDIDEGDDDTYTVVLDSEPTHSVTITVNDPSNTDVTAEPASLTFTTTNWDTAQTVTVSASHDSGHDDEDATVTHTAASSDAKYDGISVADVPVNVTDDDDVPVTVSFGQATYTVAEGSSVTVKVMLSANPERTVTIPLSTTNQGGATASDYSGVPANVVFNRGDTEKTFDFEATDDTVDDDGESIRLDFGTGLPTGVTEGSPDETVVSITDDEVPAVTVSFAQATYTVAEGSNLSIKVKLSADPERTVNIPLTKTHQGGASSSDYFSVPASVVFNPGDTEKTFDFSAASDSVDDDGESVRLGFGPSLPTGVTEGSPDETVVSITDDDVPSVTVSFAQATYTVAEGSSVTVKVKLSADPERTVTIPLTKANQGGASSSDYSGVPGSVTFNTGDTEQTFSFAAASDSDNDDGESVKLSFGSSLPTGVSQGSPDQTVVSITDDDVPSVTVSFEEGSYTVIEGNTVTVKVNLSADPERTVTIPLRTTNQGGATSSDYSGVPANVVFNSGDTEKSFTFNATDDTVDDNSESVRIGFGSSLPTGVSKGSTDETVVNIVDNDARSVTVSFGQATYTMAEGSTIAVKITLSADPQRTVTIPLTKTNQGGASDADYSGVPANVVFDSGDTEKSFTFTATADSDNDDGESVRLGFGSSLPAGVSEGSPDEAVVSITDDDVPTVTANFEQAAYTVAEGSSITIKVKLDADPERTVTIPITKSNQNGASASDYSGVPASVVFNSGDTEKTFTFNATDDTDDDDGESVRLGFGSSLPAGVSAGATNQSTVSITDNDVIEVTVNFEQGSYTVAEGSSVTVKVVLDADPERTVTIPLTTANQGGASSSDYSGVPASVVFNSGDTEKSFEFSATDDGSDDDGESVKLGFGSSLPTGVSKGSPDEAIVNITDDDVPPVTVSFEQATYMVAEGSSVAVKVVLSADPERTVQVPLTVTNVDGAVAADYSGIPGTVTFNAGDTEQSFDFTATDDTDNDDDERVRLTFGTLPARVSSTSPSQAVISITDDDVPDVTVTFGSDTHSVIEGESATITVTLSADPERTVTIPITTTNQDDASDDDYSGVPANVAFDSGETEKTFDVMITDDEEDDNDESVKLGFGTLPDAVSEGAITETVISIIDNDGGGPGDNKQQPVDDPTEVTVSFGQAAYTTAEGNSVTVTVSLDVDPQRTVAIPITATNQGGASNSDYSGVPTEVEFASGETEKTFDFEATQDTENDDGESVNLTFGTLPTGVSEGSTNETTISITDDDAPSITVSFAQATYTVAEGSNLSIKVKLSSDPERTVTIPLTKTHQGGASNSDYFSVPANVVFNSGDTEKTFDFSAAQDSVDDDGESVKLGFGSSLPAGVTKGSPDETVVSITDDDVPAVTVSFEQASYTVAEGSSVTVKVKLSADPERSLRIPLTTNHQTGLTSSDYSDVPTEVDFASGETEKSFTITAVQDDDDEDTENLILGFGTLPDGLSAGATATTTVSIRDSIHVSFAASYYQAYEGGDGAVVTVQLDRAPDSTTVIPITATGMDGATSADWTGVPDTVTFSPGQTSRTFTVMAYDDTVEDDGESVLLGFGNLPQGVARGAPSTATVELMNMEIPTYTCPTGAGETIILESVGEISEVGEADFWRVKLDPYRVYIIEVLGKDSGEDVMNRDTYSGDLTLEDPIITAVWDDGRNMMLRTGPAGSDDGGTGRNSFDIVRGVTPSGWHEIEVQGKEGTGRYQIKVRVNNVCRNVDGGETYPWLGGPDGYVMDTAGDATTGRNLMPDNNMNWTAIPGYLGDNWSWYRENEPDVDWIGINLKTGHEYTIELWTEDRFAPEYQAKDLKILGIYDTNGDLIPGTASNSGKKVSITFEPGANGKYYIAVGSGGSDRTGVYQISSEGR